MYYFLPKAFLTMDYSLLLNLFFLILTGFISGLTLLTNNLQGIIEFTIAKIFFFWERKAMRILLRKNLVMHRARNKLTSIVYALTLGCIIFLLVAVELQVQTLSNGSDKDSAADLTVHLSIDDHD